LHKKEKKKKRKELNLSNSIQTIQQQYLYKKQKAKSG
jgi:hypothetical protein